MVFRLIIYSFYLNLGLSVGDNVRKPKASMSECIVIFYKYCIFTSHIYTVLKCKMRYYQHLS